MRRLILGLALAAVPSAALAADVKKPNILVIVGDDMGYADIGPHGCKDIPTPHFDSLAKNGVRCSSGYVSGPYCSPTRAGLLTGRYQTRFGHEFNPGAGQQKKDANGLPLSETTMADRFKAAGYATGLVGKWHLGGEPEFHPMKRGFDEFFGFLGGAHPYSPGKGNRILRGTTPVKEAEYLTDAFAREAVAFIDRHKAEPFFLYLAFNATHGPMDAAEKYLKRFPDIQDPKRRIYAALMAALDDGIGAVLGKLRAEKLEGDTLVVFVADNGGPEQVNASDNGPLRGGKATTWEGGVRVPFLVQWKGKLPAGTVYDRPVIQLDILPTVLAAAGAAPPADAKFDGVNLLPHLSGESSQSIADRALFWRFGPQVAVRKGDWKLVKGAEPGAGAGGRRGAASPDGAKLFNLKADVGESKDVAADHPEKVKELAAAWAAWNKDNVPAAWGPPARAKK
jgi:arylsulfatase A-like enzyme